MDNLKGKTKLVIIDDHAIVRIGLRAVLEAYESLSFIGEAADGVSGVEVVRELKPDVVLLDVMLPGKSGYDVCRELAQLPAAPRVILLTSFMDDHGLQRALAAGASSILLKDASPEDLFRAISCDNPDASVVSPQVLQRIIQKIRRGELDEQSAKVYDLGPRERLVLSMVAEGKTNREIGEAIGLSARSTNNYFSSLLDRLGLHSRSQAAAYFATHYPSRSETSLLP